MSAERSYGRGTLGSEAESKGKAKPKFWARVRYVFDNALGSKKRFVGLIFLSMIVLAVVMTGIQALLAAVSWLNNPAPEHPTYFDQFWAAFTKILSLGGESTWSERIIAVLYWVIAIAVTGTVIGFITSLIQRTMATLSKGTSLIMESGHTLILGWSPRVFPILDELALAQASERRPVVVVFADVERNLMEDEIASRTTRKGKLRIVTRRGNLTNPADVARANVAGARSIVVLDADNNDARVLTTVLSILANAGEAHPPVIIELKDKQVAATLAAATDGRVTAVRSQDIIARVTAQASREPGLAAVVLDLLDFDGDELYFAAAGELEGKTYALAQLGFEHSSVLGVVDVRGVAELNPKASRVIAAGEQLIVLAEDDSAISFTGVNAATPSTPVKSFADSTKPKHLLVVGWSAMGRAVMNNLAGFLPTGSSIHIVARTKFVDPAELADLSFGEVKVTYATISGDVDEVIREAERIAYDEIILLGYRSSMSRSEADAHTLLTLMQMNHMFTDDSNKVQAARIVAEILDSTLLPLARVAAADDLVVSDVLGALLISQLSENPAVAPVFADLLDADGAAIRMLSVEHFATPGTEVSFASLVARGSARGESVVGYRIAAEGKTASSGVYLNPAKSHTFVPAAGDSIVVIA